MVHVVLPRISLLLFVVFCIRGTFHPACVCILRLLGFDHALLHSAAVGRPFRCRCELLAVLPHTTCCVTPLAVCSVLLAADRDFLLCRALPFALPSQI